ncbi:Dimer Tnp hAT domain-containing protein [Aphis craccivora]|uniref:Dimer Tnp hAT domain-containing protein n=1 Tax=Aphis craccivora TaxID=307492 RepID=A0A6G0Y359_APHCR|nr:Dimer Tnp hAT domain-containing protein [Aphis craccivora]
MLLGPGRWMYTPITLMDLEKPFSMYRNILRPKRLRFTNDSLSKYMVLVYLILLCKINPSD